MNILDEYRRNARECQRMADRTGNATDKASWLRLAASWLGMIKPAPAQLVENERQHDAQAEPASAAWPNPSDKDSQASH